MTNDLEAEIRKQIEVLEKIQKKLTKKVAAEREIAKFSDDFVQPDFDMSQRYEENMAAFSRFYPDIYH
ncbi:hypothetical protein ACKI16_46660, partial [Streptomyces scabiei]|uniref:hypothetical protein n=1 Tax=Streptomyces scabiei TaxID=1930 RepID=UPI0038F7B830